MSSRPKFEPQNNYEAITNEPLVSLDDSNWTSVLYAFADFPKEVFLTAALDLIQHPEYNSTLILRSEELSDLDHDLPTTIPKIQNHTPVRCIHRRLLPRRPGRDDPLEQLCTLYAPHDDDTPTLLVLTPLGTPLPYYHPAVAHIAFRWINTVPKRTLHVDTIPLPGTPLDTNSRLYRTSLALLDTVHRYMWGAMTNYKKRVHHDVLIPRELYQDRYIQMREKYKHLVNDWQEATDPLKHVFEDIGIATYLILLWESTYQDKPPAGFLDFGCGNGLLTHILISEGFEGEGIDLRARTSWSHYPPSTQAHLHVHAFDPFPSTPDPFLKPGIFLIGNHADELTPWVPLLATHHDACGFLNLPCCPWTFDAKFDRTSTKLYPLPDGMDKIAFSESLALGGHSSPSSGYSMYRVWLASLTQHCGWRVESEMMRIPSTRNWALVGRERVADPSATANVEDILRMVRERGIFKSRTPEGKAGEQ
ncbi:DUF1613-domain-containing protein, partial [Cylindrobasidium torrendii FP15055 ss-10]